MRHEQSLPPGYFEDMFRETADPWDLETSAYEREKYANTIAALGARTYSHGFEIGCAKGVLTRMLAPLCTRLLAIDVSATALASARKRCAGFPHVAFRKMAFPQQAPDRQRFDLVILSEVAYYWDDADLARAGGWLTRHLRPGGDLLLVHWTGDTDYPQSGDDAVGKLGRSVAMPADVLRADRRENYRLDLWRRRS